MIYNAKDLLKSLIARTPYRISRKPANSFDAIDEGIKNLAINGFKPSLILDCGAHLGHFATTVSAYFPEAKIHMFEPQPACLPGLEALVRQRGFGLSPVGLGAAPGMAHLSVNAGAHTGSSIASADEANVVEINISTIDVELSNTVVPDNTFLKLDIQGYELEALKGAKNTMSKCELILTEVSFYAQVYEPTPLEIISKLDDHGFKLINIFALIARPRDGRLRQGDFLFARYDSHFATDNSWD